jgi:hypothetical protein
MDNHPSQYGVALLKTLRSALKTLKIRWMYLTVYENLRLQVSSILHDPDPQTYTVKASVTRLYAFFYQPPAETPRNGWTLFTPRDEFGRMGLGSRTKAWRFTDINKDYTVRTY